MNIGLLMTSIGGFGQKGFYNAQEIGLAKALDRYFKKVIIYKLIPQGQAGIVEAVDGCKNTTLHMLPAKNIGISGIINTNRLDKLLDVLIYFSDTQISVPEVYKWARTNQVQFYPYIGVLESHSTNKLKKMIMDTLFFRNRNIYRKCHCLVKTPAVEKKIRAMGVNNTSVLPVGLDLTLLHRDEEMLPVQQLKRKYGFETNDRVVLFIGRLIAEKRPIQMLEVFSELYKRDNHFKLLMVGQGPLQMDVDTAIKSLGLKDCIKNIEKIPNSEIWELYRFADCFINLNRQEIFGMAILEAMYYGCKVIAWVAPGPELIIEDGISGYIVDSNELLYSRVMESEYFPENGRKRVLEHFTWDNMARYMDSLVQL